MQLKRVCPHCGKKVYEIITVYKRVEKEGVFNACEYCKFEEDDIRDKVNLRELYVKFNKMYFNNKLPNISKVKIEWNIRSSSTAGICFQTKKLIEISVRYHNLHPEELDSTLVHEMIHLKENGHKTGFKREAERITKMGLKITIYTKYSETKRVKWKYECVDEDCLNAYRRVQRIKNIEQHACHKCGGKLKEIQLLE